MENQIHSKNTSNTELSIRIGDFFPVLLATVVAIVEWASWKPGSSLIADFIPGITQAVSFMLAISLLCLSVFLLATSEGIKNLAEYYSIDIFAGTKALDWKPGKQRAAELALPLFLLIIIIMLTLWALSEARRDLSTATGKVTLIYFLSVAAVILGRIKIPAYEVPAVPKGGMIYERNTTRKNLNLTGYPTYVLTNDVYLRAGNMLAVDGQRLVILDSHRSLSAVEVIDIVSPAFAATLKVVITPLTGNFPEQIDQDDLPKVLHWHSASAKDRKDMVEISAAGLSGIFEKYLKQMFGITEQGQFLFDSLARTIKANAMRGLDILSNIDLKAIASRLEISLSNSLFGAAVFHKPVYRIELSFISHELKGHFAQLNSTIGNINIRNDQVGIELREQTIQALLDVYRIHLTPENLEQAAGQIRTLFEDPSALKLHTQEVPVIKMQPSIADQQTLGSFEDIFQKSEGLTRLGNWLNGQQEVKRLAREKEMINRLYFTMIEFRLISHLPAGMDSHKIMLEIEAHFEEDIAEILNPDSAIYGTEMQKMAVAERILHKMNPGQKYTGS